MDGIGESRLFLLNMQISDSNHHLLHLADTTHLQLRPLKVHEWVMLLAGELCHNISIAILDCSKILIARTMLF